MEKGFQIHKRKLDKIFTEIQKNKNVNKRNITNEDKNYFIQFSESNKIQNSLKSSNK